MGLWANTVYVNSGSVDAVVETLKNQFATEDMVPTTVQTRNRLLYEPMQYDDALHNDHWSLAVFPGASSWTVIQSAPLELMAEHLANSDRRRISDLCVELSCSALLVNVYDSSDVVLAECANTGEVLVCGWTGQPGAGDPYREHNESVDEDSYRLRLRINTSLEVDLENKDGEELAWLFAKRCGGANAEHCSNLVSVDTLICRKPFNVPGGIALHFVWRGASRQRYRSSETWETHRAQKTHRR